MSGLIIGGSRVPVPGVSVVTWIDDPKRAPKITDGKVRRVAPSAVCLHTSRGVRGNVQPGARPSSRAETLALYQSRTERQVSWHLTIDTDGDVLQQEDLSTWMAWHASHANGWTVGIELVQHPDSGDLWQAQIDAAVSVVAAICDTLSIPKRIPVDATGSPVRGVVKAWQEASEGGRQGSWSGVIGHRHLTINRGVGDPGDWIFLALLARGFAGETVE